MLCTTVRNILTTYIVCLPLQLRPFPASTYPEPQEQVKLPWLLVQVWSQPPLLVAHSLMSVEKGWVVFVLADQTHTQCNEGCGSYFSTTTV